MVLKLCLIEVDRPKFPCFWKTENVLHVNVNVDRNQEGTKRSIQHEKCSIIYLLNASGFVEPLEKQKIKFMLENLELVKTNLWKMVELYKYVSFACRKP